jgi:hypothetical protein
MKPGRVLLSFNVVGMAAREAMLLKSFVRMLDGRTMQRWLFKPRQDGDEKHCADLIFLGDEGGESELQPSNAQPPRQLRMGVLALELFARLDRPLRPDELEHELNRMGTLIVQARATQMVGESVDTFTSTPSNENASDAPPSSRWRPGAEGSRHSGFTGTVPASLPGKVVVAAPPPVRPSPTKLKIPVALDDGLSLLRWPHANLINTPARLKLAAFMVGSTTLRNLQKNSGQPLQACTEFLEDLHASGFLCVVAEQENSAVIAAKLDAVRNKSAVPAGAKPVPRSSGAHEKAIRAAPALPSLFARIRARLGISVAG